MAEAKAIAQLGPDIINPEPTELIGGDSGEVSDALSEQYGIATRPGAHCAPLMHKALGTVQQGAVRFSFSHYNTKEEIEIAVAALRELAMEE